MNNEDRLELEQLKRRHELLQQQVASLKTHLDRFEQRVENAPTEPQPVVTAPPLAPEPIRVHVKPPPIVPQPAPVFAATSALLPVPPIIAEPEEKTSFELRLGTFWLVRVGIVVLLTGLAFLGYYAYDNFVGRLGPGGKLTLIYFAGVLLGGAGTWLQRRGEKPALKNYGQVLFAGALATIYFATYAAHYLPPLRVIESGVLDGILLLAWVGVIVWIADHRKSEILALFAICLAYYTAVVTDIGLFTLYSNVILTAAAVFFLLRNRWATLSIVTLPATYGAFVFWRFYHHGDFVWNLPSTQLTYGNVFLAGYWVIFTAAVFLSQSEKLIGVKRAAYLSANNAAFFGMVILSMLHVNSGSFWKFSLGFGVMLIGLAAAARKWLAQEPLAAKAYLSQGLLLVTLGFIAYFSGLKLALVLAAERTMLLVLSYQQNSSVMRWGSIITAILTFPFMVGGLELHASLSFGLGVGALLAFETFWVSRREQSAPAGSFRPLTTFFSLLALFAWAYVDWKFVPHEWFGSSMAIGAVLLMLAFYLIKIPELVLLGQGYLLVAQFIWIAHAAEGTKLGWWHPLLVIVATVGASHWWQWQKSIVLRPLSRDAMQAIYALATIGVIYTWLQPQFQPGFWLAFTSLLALGITIYALATRAWLLAAAAQCFLIISAVEFVRQLLAGKPDWYFALMPMIVLTSLVWVISEFFIDRLPKESQQTIPQVSFVYLGMAVIMSLWWVHEYIPTREQIWVYGLVGTLIFLASGWKRNAVVAAFGGVYLVTALAGLAIVYLGQTPEIYIPNLLFIVVLLGLQQLARRLPDRFLIAADCKTAMIVAGVLALWLVASRWVNEVSGSDSYMTATWAGLALIVIATGFALRERMYRWIGLAILACALGRVVIDVWKLEIIFRILSLLALGVVLSALGFVYNKYQEKIREWL
jgi:uncharacterized membrane protein